MQTIKMHNKAQDQLKGFQHTEDGLWNKGIDLF